MKKLSYLILGLAGLTMSSCSQDDLIEGVADGNYQVRINLPADVATRAIGDNALAAQQLNYAIFDDNGEYVSQGTASFGGNTSMTLPLSLASGASFKIAFFAQSPNSTDVYKFNAGETDHSVTVDYDAMDSDINNADGYDCFYNVLETGIIGSSTMNTQVTLNRIVAQINWGTSDYDQATVTNTYGTNLADLTSTLTVTVPTVFDLLTGETDGADEVTIGSFTPNNAPGQETFPVTGYQYVAMQYVLVPADKGLYNLDLAVSNEAGTADNPITVDNAPVQANYRTNIYGNLLTDNIQFQVDLSADWGTPDYNLPQPWDGTTIEVPVANSEGVFEIMTPAQWVGLPQAVVPSRSVSNANVKLGANLDFGGYTISPLEFTGTLDGQGYTISNVTFGLSGGYASGLLDNQAVGGNITVQNLTIATASSVNHSYDSSNAWGYTGAVIGALQNNATLTIDNVTVRDANFDGIQSVGGLVGFVASGTTVNISNSTVEDSYLTNMPYVNESGFVAGLVGRPVGTVNILDGNSLSNVTINGYWATRRGENSIAEVVGGKTINNVNISDVKVTATQVKDADQVVSSSSDLSSAFSKATEGSSIFVTAGEYGNFPSASKLASDVTITCAPGTTFTAKNNDINLNGGTLIGATFKWPEDAAYEANSGAVKGTLSGTYVNCTFVGMNGTRYTYAKTGVKFENCLFTGTGVYAFHTDGSSGSNGTIDFTGCDFDGFLAMAAGVSCNYDNCTFKINSSSKYGGGNFWGDSTFNNCNFYLPNPTKSFQYIALATAGKTYVFNNCYNEGSLITVDFPFTANSGVTVTCNNTSKTF